MDLALWIQFLIPDKKTRDQYPIRQEKLYSLQQEHFHSEVHNTYSPKGS